MNVGTTRNDSAFHVIEVGAWRTMPPGKKWRIAHILLTKDDTGVSAVVLNLPGCASPGDTLEEALANVRDALDGALAQYAADGAPAPWRNSRDDEIPHFSEQRYIQVEEGGA